MPIREPIGPRLRGFFAHVGISLKDEVSRDDEGTNLSENVRIRFYNPDSAFLRAQPDGPEREFLPAKK